MIKIISTLYPHQLEYQVNEFREHLETNYSIPSKIINQFYYPATSQNNNPDTTLNAIIEFRVSSDQMENIQEIMQDGDSKMYTDFPQPSNKEYSKIINNSIQPSSADNPHSIHCNCKYCEDVRDGFFQTE